MSDLVESWEVAARITAFVLEAIDADALQLRPASRAWTIGQHFVHLHNTRCDWLAAQPAVPELPDKLPRETGADKAALLTALAQSAEAMAKMLAAAESRGKISGFRRSPTAFLGYLVAHESYHQAEICVYLAQGGRRLPNEIVYGIWDWGRR